MGDRTVINPVTHQGNDGYDHEYRSEGKPDSFYFSQADGDANNMHLTLKVKSPKSESRMPRIEVLDDPRSFRGYSKT